MPHHLVGVWGRRHEGDVARYAALAHAAIDDVLARGGAPIVAGGTGLYLRAALADLEPPPAPPPGLRERIAGDGAAGAALHARAARASTPAPPRPIAPQRPPPRGAGAGAGRSRRQPAPGRRRRAVERGHAPPDAARGARRAARRAARAASRRARDAMLDGGVVEEVRGAAGAAAARLVHVRPRPRPVGRARAAGQGEIAARRRERARCTHPPVRQAPARRGSGGSRRVRLVDGTLPVAKPRTDRVMLAAVLERRLYHPRRDHPRDHRGRVPRRPAASSRPPTRSPRPSPCSTPARLAWPSRGPDGAWTVNALAAAGDPAVLPPARGWRSSSTARSRTTTRSRSRAWTAGVRVVPPATVRHGAFVEPGAILMPSYVNIGARVGAGTMVDTWATVGSGAQIGRDVHLVRRRRHRRRARAARRAAGDHRGRRLHRLARHRRRGRARRARGGARRRRGAHRSTADPRRHGPARTPSTAAACPRAPSSSRDAAEARSRPATYGVPCALIIGQPHASRPTARRRSTRRCGSSMSPSERDARATAELSAAPTSATTSSRPLGYGDEERWPTSWRPRCARALRRAPTSASRHCVVARTGGTADPASRSSATSTPCRTGPTAGAHRTGDASSGAARPT